MWKWISIKLVQVSIILSCLLKRNCLCNSAHLEVYWNRSFKWLGNSLQDMDHQNSHVLWVYPDMYIQTCPDIFLNKIVDPFIWKIVIQIRIYYGNFRHLLIRVILLFLQLIYQNYTFYNCWSAQHQFSLQAGQCIIWHFKCFCSVIHSPSQIQQNILTTLKRLGWSFFSRSLNSWEKGQKSKSNEIILLTAKLAIRVFHSSRNLMKEVLQIFGERV